MLQKLIDKITQAKNKGLPFVVYNKPNSKVLDALFQQNNQLIYHNNFDESGFVFAPFDKQQASVIFPLNQCVTYQTDFDQKESIDFSSKVGLNLMNFDKKAKKTHIVLVKKGIKFLKENEVLKVVLSRKEEIELISIDIIDVFLKLLEKYPSAFVYVWYHPKVGLWMGASPETLLSVKGNTFKTMALAGTQTYQGSIEVEWEKKEKEEQQIITDYILDKIHNKNTIVSKPFTKKAGSLLHICTEISGKLAKKNQLKNLVQSLHPTPAVCGLPKDKAQTFILENENYNREFYTGYLGELHMKEQSHLFVNLRCMQLKKQKAIVYVGGGITLDSEPEKEWQETVAKSEVMKRVLVN